MLDCLHECSPLLLSFSFFFSFGRQHIGEKTASQSEVAQLATPVSNYIKSIVLIDFINITEIASAIPFRQGAGSIGNTSCF